MPGRRLLPELLQDYLGVLQQHDCHTTEDRRRHQWETPATSAARSLPTLRAPKVQALDDWRDVKDYWVDNLVKSHLYNFDYKEAARTVGAYYSTFNELRLPPATTPGENEDSESEEEILTPFVPAEPLWLENRVLHKEKF